VNERVSRYSLSFTSGGLLISESLKTLPVWQRARSWEAVRDELMSTNTLQLRTVQSRRTISREVVERLSTLSPLELDLLGDASTQERAHVMWVAACRRHTLVGEFAEEVVRERFLILTPHIAHDDFDTFVRGKSLWHPEVETITETTRRKLRQSVFRMLRESGLVDDTGFVVPALLTSRLASILNAREPSDLRFFPTAQGGAR
jgi:hypothetical protein